jgi:hypothetical protein
MWDVAEKRIRANTLKITANTPTDVDGNAKMPMALKLSAMKGQDLRANAWWHSSADHRHAIIVTLKSSALKEEKGQLR